LKSILSSSYSIQNLSDFKTHDLTNLHSVDPTGLRTITFTQACKEYAAAGINTQ